MAREGTAASRPSRSRTPARAGDDRPDYLGHRERLRDRLLAGGTAPLADYELLEFLLYAARPRGDTKPLAKSLIARFGSLAGVLGAERDALLGVDGIGAASAAALLAVREAGRRLVRAEVRHRHVISSWQLLLDYLTATAGYAETEEFHLLFLDRKNVLIADERQQRGTVDHVPVYPREVVKRALDLGAAAVIMVHNHPSGDTTPSKGDIEMTRAVVKALAAVSVAVHDHVVVGRGRHSSFKSLGLLQ
ncbi:MAG TPA: DNA repair protein RadC [Stellaceae bacterium]|nr:DNA repair protein RadC [Stellaceae bacterium]